MKPRHSGVCACILHVLVPMPYAFTVKCDDAVLGKILVSVRSSAHRLFDSRDSLPFAEPLDPESVDDQVVQYPCQDSRRIPMHYPRHLLQGTARCACAFPEVVHQISEHLPHLNRSSSPASLCRRPSSSAPA